MIYKSRMESSGRFWLRVALAVENRCTSYSREGNCFGNGEDRSTLAYVYIFPVTL